VAKGKRIETLTSQEPVPQVEMTLLDERCEIETTDAEGNEVGAAGEDF